MLLLRWLKLVPSHGLVECLVVGDGIYSVAPVYLFTLPRIMENPSGFFNWSAYVDILERAKVPLVGRSAVLIASWSGASSFDLAFMLS